MNNDDNEDDEGSADDFNEEDFDEGPGPGVYIPQTTISGQPHDEKLGGADRR